MMELSDMVVFASSDHGPYNSHQTPTSGTDSLVVGLAFIPFLLIVRPRFLNPEDMAHRRRHYGHADTGSPDGPSSLPGSCLNCCPAAPYQDTWPDCFRNRNGPWCRSLRQARRYSQHRSREYSQSGGPEGSIPKVP